MSKVLLFSLLFFLTASFADGFEIPSPGSTNLASAYKGDDFDGDGSIDIIVKSEHPDEKTGIYSYAKKEFLLILTGNEYFIWANFDTEPGMEVITEKQKIYKYSESGTGTSAK